MCSITGDEISRIEAAIDQLACDAREVSEAGGTAGDGVLKARVASLWRMIGDLDPDLARRAQRYTDPADDEPSA